MEGWGGGGGEIIYLSLHCHHQNDSCIKMGSDESHFNVSLRNSEGQSHKTVSTNRNFSEGQPKRNRTEALLGAYQPNALPLGQTGSQMRQSLISQIKLQNPTGSWPTVSEGIGCTTDTATSE